MAVDLRTALGLGALGMALSSGWASLGLQQVLLITSLLSAAWWLLAFQPKLPQSTRKKVVSGIAIEVRFREWNRG